MARFSAPTLLTLLLVVSLTPPTATAFRETKPCTRFTDAMKNGIALKPGTDQCCRNNACPDSCCRYYTTGLVWDEDDDFPHLPCVCNSRTVDPASFFEDNDGGDRADDGENTGGGIGTGTGGTGTGTGTGTGGTGTGGTGAAGSGSKSAKSSKRSSLRLRRY